MGKSLYVSTPDGRKTVLLDLWTGVGFYDQWGYFLRVYHGDDHTANVNFRMDEARALINVCRPIRSCWKRGNGICWAARQTKEVPDGCLRCALSKVFLDQQVIDLREAIEAPVSPWKVPMAVAGALWIGTWILAQGYTSAYEIEHQARLRAESRLATFERQGKAGKR